MEVNEKKLSDKRERYLKRRRALIELSKLVRAQMGDGGPYDSVNEGLKEIYAEDGHEELNTYMQWREQGYQVQKGAEALLVWGKPRSTEQGEEDEEEDTKFWPVCYLFSNLQVKQI